MHIQPCKATLGAAVTEVALANVDDDAFAEIKAAWHEFAVLIFPAQQLTDEQHLGFTRRFGRLERGLKRSSTTGLGQLSNVASDGSVVPPDHLQKRFQLGNQQWHSDSSYKRVGAKASILAAHVVPGEGGETEWADMRAAYDALDSGTQSWLADRVAVHSYRFSHAWHGGLELLDEEELEHLPAVEHPLVRTHPETGRRSLFVGRHASHIVGEEVLQSRRRLREMTDAACQPPRTVKHKWRPGDIAIWDNRCVLHRGHPWPAGEARVMVRTTVAGEDPSNEWALG